MATVLDYDRVQSRAPRPATTRGALFDLFGGYAIEGGREPALSLRAIGGMADALGLSQASARAAAARMAERGWLVPADVAGDRGYRLSAEGERIVRSGRERIFGGSPQKWDGTWSMVAVSVPEARRSVRDRLRKELAWRGFGSPSPGLFISPRAEAGIAELARELDAEEFVQVYRATTLAPRDLGELVGKAWPDLDEADRRYAAFINRFSPAAKGVAAGEAFRTCFALLSEFRHCLFADPGLPPELLPPAWWGTAARELFLSRHRLLIGPALEHFDSLRAVTA